MTPDLARAIEAGSIIVTPNRRLAARLKREFDRLQSRAGKTVWPSADCLPLAAFFQRLYHDLTRAAPAAVLLTPHQAQALWERVVRVSEADVALIDPAGAARSARQAWLIQHAYRFEPAALDDATRLYFDWSLRVADAMRENGWIDDAWLPERINEAVACDTSRAAQSLVLFGFDELNPQVRAVLDALGRCGWGITEHPVPGASAGHHAQCRFYEDREAELTAVAFAARSALEAGAASRIGVIVPDLSAARNDLIRIFEDVLHPDSGLAAPGTAARAFDVSLGRSLADHPMIHAALLILELANGSLPVEAVGSLLRSPFAGGADAESAGRALLDAALREDGRPVVALRTLSRRASRPLFSHATALQELMRHLEAFNAVATEARRARHAPSGWSTVFRKLLAALRWPGDRTLDSEEYQTWEKWQESLNTLAQLDAILPRLDLQQALARLRRIAADTLFQAESPETPVEVMGVLEANGLEFDLLFVTGMTDEAWPPPARPNPFLPVAWQRRHHVPHASSEWTLDYARRTMQRWLGAAPAIVFSAPRREGDRAFGMSALLRDVPLVPPAVCDVSLYREAVRCAGETETIIDVAAPALAAGIQVSGGVALFQDQAACPFKAFATHRLGARPLGLVQPGLDARARGLLVHRAAEFVWRELQDSKRLAAAGAAELRAIVERAVAAAAAIAEKRRPDVMTAAFFELACERVTALLLRLLELEKQRPPFAVLLQEARHSLSIGDIRVSIRLDRVDRLADGSLVVLDYKTSREVSAEAWLGPRPDEPQLPLYAAMNDSAKLAAVAFVSLNARSVGFEGYSQQSSVLPGVPAFSTVAKAVRYGTDWHALLERWRHELQQLALEYRSGRADIAPKSYPRTCALCALGAFCRIKEVKRAAFDASADGENA